MVECLLEWGVDTCPSAGGSASSTVYYEEVLVVRVHPEILLAGVARWTFRNDGLFR
jgi:hypothetical protein